MDRKEAVEWIEKAMEYMGLLPSEFWIDGKIGEAIDLAIKALEREIEYGQMVVDFTKGETMKSDEWKYDTTCDAESATTNLYDVQLAKDLLGISEEAEKHQLSGETPTNTPTCNQTCNKKQVTSKLENAETATSEGEESTMNQPKSKLDCISRQQAIEEVEKKYFGGTVADINPSWRKLHNILESLPPVTPTVAPKPIMTEAVREALMRLSMCAREECTICKYENNCGFDKQVEMATDNMHVILNAFDTAPTERTGEWIPVKKVYRTNDADFPNTHIEWETATYPDDVDAVRCSECGEVFDFADARNWCTECGAKMNKGGDTE